MEYTPRHNIGHLRYLACAAVDEMGRPALEVRPWSDLLFPYDPAIPVDERVTPGDVGTAMTWAGPRSARHTRATRTG